MRPILLLILLVGLASSAILDTTTKKLSSKSSWDDEDSMTFLPSPNPPSKPPFEEDATERPRFISLIPRGYYEVNTEQQPEADIFSKGTLYQVDRKPAPEAEQEITLTTPHPSSVESNSDSESVESPSTTEAPKSPKLHFVQLGKIPLTVDVIPLLETDHLLGRQNERPVGFFPSEEYQGQDRHSRGEDEDDTESVKEPLTYLVPPRGDAEDYWSKYPLNKESSTDDDQFVVTPLSATINPILERLNQFLQKAKRHSIEEQEQQPEITSVSSITPSSQDEDDDSSTPSPAEDIIVGTPILTTPAPKPLAQPSVELTPPQPEAIFPQATTWTYPSPRQSLIEDQYFSDFNSNNNLIGPSPIYSPSRLVSAQQLKPPRPPAYPTTSGFPSYWHPPQAQARRYFYGEDYSPFVDYLRAQRSFLNNRFAYAPPGAGVNNFLNEDERPFLGGFSSYYNYNNYDNQYYPYSYASPSSYAMNQQNYPFIPYRPSYYNNYQYPNSSPFVNNLMYAPHYPHDQYRRIPAQPEF